MNGEVSFSLLLLAGMCLGCFRMLVPAPAAGRRD